MRRDGFSRHSLTVSPDESEVLKSEKVGLDGDSRVPSPLQTQLLSTFAAIASEMARESGNAELVKDSCLIMTQVLDYKSEIAQCGDVVHE